MKHSIRFAVLAMFALAGCSNSSQIQSRYTSQQDACRSEALAYSAAAATDPNAAESSAGLRFSECMNRTGWRVSMPRPTQTATGPAPNPPSGSPSTDPIASAASAPAPSFGAVSPSEGTATLYRGPHGSNETVSPVANAPAVPSQSYPYSQPSGAPSTAPSAAAARYQPARPTTVQAPAYGSGAGRQF